MKEHLLDPDGLTTLPKGYIRIDTEVGFLKAATEQRALLVTGHPLCSWAEAFFKGRGLAFRYVRPLVDELRDICPALTAEQAQKIIGQINPQRLERLKSPFTLTQVLEEFYPSDIWRKPASVHHVADWLVWIYETDPDEHVRPLLEQMGKQWHERLNQHESSFYCITRKEEAGNVIEQWLTGETPDTFSTAFPAQQVPPKILDRVLERWQSQIVKSQGQYFSTVVDKDTSYTLKEKAADYTAQYFVSNPSRVTQEQIQELSRFIGSDTLNKLRNILPPKEPTPPPNNPEAVISWFRDSYFAYREWQSNQDNARQASELVVELAKQFALWYLETFPPALLKNALTPLLTMNKMARIMKKHDVVTLVIVLDGLHYGDARDLMQKIGNTVPRLTITSDDLAFASLPTITQFCKPPLFHGTPLRHVDDTLPVGQIIADKQDPVTLLSEAKPGERFLWRVSEPDKTYHSRNSSDMLSQEVRGRLDTVAQNIQEIVERVPDQILLEIVVTTDHGRLLSRSERKVRVPPGMKSHGRAAWGNSQIVYGEVNHLLNGNIAYLDGFSYGLPSDVAIILDESAFKTNDDRGGSELYPHGGLFPEEVIVPWLVYARDVKQPVLEATISGSGISRQRGELTISIVNMDLRAVTIQNVTLQLPRETQILETNFDLAPQSKGDFQLDFEPWFSAEEVDKVKAIVSVQLNNGLDFDIEADITVQSEDMYRRDNILEDLF